MDDLGDLIPLLFFLFIVLRAVRGLKGAARRAPTDPATGNGGISALEQITREIRRAVEEAQREAAGERPSTGAPAPAPSPAASRRGPTRGDAEFQTKEAEVDDFRPVERGAAPDFHFVGGPDEPLQPAEFHEAHPFARAASPSAAMPGRDMPGAHLHDPRAAGAAPRRHPLAAALRRPGAARQAVILQEVLGPPRSRR